MPGEQRRDGGRPGPAGVRVVGQALRHEQRAQVGVADTQLAESPGRLADLGRRVVGVAHDDLLTGEEHRHRRLEPFDVELVVLVEEREQIDRGQIAALLSR